MLYRHTLDNEHVYDAAIVPGVPFEKGRWDSVMKARVLWSYVLYKKGIVKNIIYSGSAVYSPFYESKIMGLYAEAIGIPRENIFCETQAEHSTENVFYGYELARRQGFKTIALATDPFQSIMLKRFTENRFGTPIFHLPIILDSIKTHNYLDPVIDSTLAYQEGFISLKQREGFWKRWRGTTGLSIPWEKGRKAAAL